MPLFPVILDGITFWTFSIPDSLNFGGAQRLGVHQMPRGIRVIDAMGPDDDDIRWSGMFIKTNDPAEAMEPLGAARHFDYLRKIGAPVTLTYADAFVYTVVIEHFKGDFQYVSRIPFEMILKVIEDQTMPGPNQTDNDNPDNLTDADLRNALSASNNLGMTVPNDQIGPVSTALGSASSLLPAGVAPVASPAPEEIDTIGLFMQPAGSGNQISAPTEPTTTPLFPEQSQSQAYTNSTGDPSLWVLPVIPAPF